MKYSNEVVIDQQRTKVIELFDNPDNMKFWQKGLISFESLSGEPNKPGSQSLLKYEMGKRSIEMTETIISNNFPDEFVSTYETKGIFNTQKNHFREEGHQTRWISSSEFKCSGFMKIISFFFGEKTFKRQSQVYMDDFKAFAEGNPRYGQ